MHLVPVPVVRHLRTASPVQKISTLDSTSSALHTHFTIATSLQKLEQLQQLQNLDLTRQRVQQS